MRAFLAVRRVGAFNPHVVQGSVVIYLRAQLVTVELALKLA